MTDNVHRPNFHPKPRAAAGKQEVPSECPDREAGNLRELAPDESDAVLEAMYADRGERRRSAADTKRLRREVRRSIALMKAETATLQHLLEELVGEDDDGPEGAA